MVQYLVPFGFLLLLAALLYAAVKLTLKSFRNVGTALAEAKAGSALVPTRQRSAAALAAATPPSPAITPADRELLTNLLSGMAAQLAHEEAMIEERGTEACIVRLAPQVPIRSAASLRSWLGGGLRLPHGMAWPEIDGTKAAALAQLSLADLPADVWDGLGPRTGWLAIVAHPDDWTVKLLHLPSADVYHSPPAPVGPAYCWSQTDPRPGQPAHLPRVWPQWPVEPIAVRPGDPDPYVEDSYDGHHSRYKAGYDLRDAGLHPFDWPSLLALCDVLEGWMGEYLKPFDPATPSPLDDQIAKLRVRLDDPELSAGQRAQIARNIDFLGTLISASRDAALANAEARARAEEIIAIVRETHAAGEPFSANDAAAVVEALGAIEWQQVKRENDPDRPGAERVTTLRLPLTRHDAEASGWVYAYDQRHAALAKRAYTADPGQLPSAQRAHYEPIWQAQARHEMPSLGHIPIGYVHDFDSREDVTIIEIPTGHLLDWMFGDCHHLVLTMKKADLDAGRWDKMLLQISN